MGYDAAINKAWEELSVLKPAKSVLVRFLADEYNVDTQARKVFSVSCNVPAKDFTAILVLHYLAQKIKGLPVLAGEWLTFRELSAVEGYLDAFRKRSIEPIVRKYGSNPEGVFNNLNKLSARKVSEADAALIVEAFDGVPALVKIWHKDEDFSADANIYFDRSITKIFCTEDIVVLAGTIAYSL